MRRLVFLALPVLIAIGFGCNSAAPMRPSRPKTYSKIISLSPGTTEIVMGQTDAGQAVKGRTQADNWPSYGITAVPVVASVKPDYGAIAKIQPDFVIYDAALYSPTDVEKLKETAKGADMFAVSANTVDDFVKQLYEIGSMVGGETRINDYVMKIYASREKSQGDENANPPKVAVIMPSEGGPDYIAGAKSFVADTVRAAGGTPVGPDSPIFTQVNAEALAGFNPDIIVVPGTKTNFKGAMSILNNPSYKTTNAVKNKRIRVIDQDILLRRGGRVDLLIDGLNTIVSSTK